MEEIRLIKKYPNRRLYDTVSSRYITLDEIKALVLKHIVFKVIDDHLEDVTDHVLLQLLAQEENKHPPIFTRQLLQNLICFYGHPSQQALSEFLEKGMALFAEREFSAYVIPNVNNEDESFIKIAAATRHHLELWQSVLKQFLDQDSER
ncbi:MAG: polyhydroxyalkanoate synthesis regulator DNA-binding domain-containing protein [Pseudomonadota bacterium]